MRKLWLAFLLLFAFVGAVQAAVPSCIGGVPGQYFIANDTSPGAQVFDPSRGFVANSDAAYKTWLAGTAPCQITAISAVTNNGSGNARLTVTSTTLLASNQWLEVYGTGIYDGTWQITVIDGTHIDLLTSTFSATATGGLYGPQIYSTAAAIYANVSAYNVTAWGALQQQNSLSFNTSTTLTVAQLARTLLIANTSGGNIQITLPSVTLAGSIPIGYPINIISNNGPGANTISIKSAAGTFLTTSMNGGSAASLSPYASDDTHWVNWALTQFGNVNNPSLGTLLVGQGNANGFNAQFQSVTGDCVVSSTGVMTCSGGSRNALRNSSLTAWFHGCVVAACTITTSGGWCAEGVFVIPTGASVTCLATVTVPTGSPGRTAMQITGATGVTDVKVRFVIESFDAARLAGNYWSFQVPIINNIGSSLVASIATAYPTTTDGGVVGGGAWSATTTDMSGVTFPSCANGVSCVLAYHNFQASANARNGYEFVVDFGAIVAAQSITIGAGFDAHALLGATGAAGFDTNPPPPEVRTTAEDIAWCQRFFTSNYPNLFNAPGNNVYNFYYMGAAISTTTIDGQGILFPVQMRNTPTITFYSPNAGTPANGLWEFYNPASGNVNSTATATLTNTPFGFNPSLTVTGVSNNQGFLIFGTWTADATIWGG